jgi:hypothetical protein
MHPKEATAAAEVALAAFLGAVALATILGTAADPTAGITRQHLTLQEQQCCQVRVHISTAAALQTAAMPCATGAMASGLQQAAVLQEVASATAAGRAAARGTPSDGPLTWIGSSCHMP